LGRIARREQSANTRSGLGLCEQRRKTAQALVARRVALKKGRGPRWLLSYSPLRGCAFGAALPAAFFECNRGYPHLISGSIIDNLKLMIAEIASKGTHCDLN
jgi:hypothetical protein